MNTKKLLFNLYDNKLESYQMVASYVTSRIRRLQNRIYKASLLNKREKVHFLQRKLIYNLYAKLVSVRRVTTENKGRNSPGLDLQLYISPRKKTEKLKLAKSLKIDGRASPIRRK
uniref:Reverse transcriptase N-terminal domain-containing protein n=1 Tax=Caulerpa lentillifera TaxID=148947 RepID=A0A345HH07_9CHLO|nr:hypothetical protein [Caulerpa lentillifera]AXG75897.1 hypothetical protein [Caulerpa lentillifera]QKS32311.1 hypothetical protein [Caulerpa lentillifera]QUV75635.1 hypothetical protein [Caulerpa lentillifera]